MSELTKDNLDTLILGTYNQILALQTEKAALMTELGTIDVLNDVNSVASSGSEGSESYSRQTLTQKIAELGQLERLLTEALVEQNTLKRHMFPYEEVLVQYL